jgi:hypothetical protein
MHALNNSQLKCWSPGRMRKLLAKYKPGASIRTHLLVAASIWTTVGMALFLRGWMGFPEGKRFFFVLGGMAIGTIKSFLVLDRAARKNIQRILACHERYCIGGVYSVRMWGMVLLMIVGGRLVRSFTPDAFTWLLYLAIGWALVLSSRLVWQRWRAVWA